MSEKITQLADEQLLRYSRHILLPQMDIAGQLAVTNGSVLIVGLGGLGSPVALYLAAAGVGELILADFDEVEISNLQRQIIHQQSTVGLNKAQSAADHITQINSSVKVQTVEQLLDESALNEWVQRVDVVVDCSDNFATRCSVNRVCWQLQKPLVSGAAIRFEGQLAVFDGRDRGSPCYQCLFPALPEEQLTCSQSGVLSPLVGVIGSMQAVEVIKLLATCGRPSVGRLQLYDAFEANWRSFGFAKDKSCPNCGDA